MHERGEKPLWRRFIPEIPNRDRFSLYVSLGLIILGTIGIPACNALEKAGENLWAEVVGGGGAALLIAGGLGIRQALRRS